MLYTVVNSGHHCVFFYIQPSPFGHCCNPQPPLMGTALSIMSCFSFHNIIPTPSWLQLSYQILQPRGPPVSTAQLCCRGITIFFQVSHCPPATFLHTPCVECPNEWWSVVNPLYMTLSERVIKCMCPSVSKRFGKPDLEAFRYSHKPFLYDSHVSIEGLNQETDFCDKQ